MSGRQYLAVYTTLPDAERAREIARRLVAERLVACVNCFPIESTYRWRGAIEEAQEVALVMKTRAALYAALERRLRELHPYEVPAVVAYDVTRGFPDYLAWIGESTT